VSHLCPLVVPFSPSRLRSFPVPAPPTSDPFFFHPCFRMRTLNAPSAGALLRTYPSRHAFFSSPTGIALTGQAFLTLFLSLNSPRLPRIFQGWRMLKPDLRFSFFPTGVLQLLALSGKVFLYPWSFNFFAKGPFLPSGREMILSVFSSHSPPFFSDHFFVPPLEVVLRTERTTCPMPSLPAKLFSSLPATPI